MFNFVPAYMKPSRRVADFLLTYLEFDKRELQLALWSGDLRIDNVKIKDDILTDLLPSTSSPLGNAGRQNHRERGREGRESDDDDRNDKVRATGKHNNNNHRRRSDPIRSNNGMPLDEDDDDDDRFRKGRDSVRSDMNNTRKYLGKGKDSFVTGGTSNDLEKEDSTEKTRRRSNTSSKAKRDGHHRLGQPFSPLPFPLHPPDIGFKIIRGDIGRIRLVLPWKSLLMGTNISSSSPVILEISDVTIVIGLEVLPFSHSEDVHGTNDKYHHRHHHPDCNSDTPTSEQSSHFATENSERRRELLREAQLWLLGEVEELPDEFYQNTPSNNTSSWSSSQNSHSSSSSEGSTSSTTAGTISASSDNGFLARFAKSFASSLGWKVGRDVQATFRNLNVVFVVPGDKVMGESVLSGKTGNRNGSDVTDGGVARGAVSSVRDGIEKEGDVIEFGITIDRIRVGEFTETTDDVNDEEDTINADFNSNSSNDNGYNNSQGSNRNGDRNPGHINGNAVMSNAFSFGTSFNSGSGSEKRIGNDSRESISKLITINSAGVYTRRVSLGEGMGGEELIKGKGVSKKMKKNKGKVKPNADGAERSSQHNPRQSNSFSPPLHSEYVLRPVSIRAVVKWDNTPNRIVAKVDSSSEIIREGQTEQNRDSDSSMNDEASTSSSITKRKRRGKREKKCMSVSSSTISNVGDEKERNGMDVTVQEEKSLNSSKVPTFVQLASVEKASSVGIKSRTVRTTEIGKPSSVEKFEKKKSLSVSSKSNVVTPQISLVASMEKIAVVIAPFHLSTAWDAMARIQGMYDGRPDRMLPILLLRSSVNDGTNIGGGRGNDKKSSNESCKLARAWWRYSGLAVLRSVRKRRALRGKFRIGREAFDWRRQGYRRAEYVELYAVLRLGIQLGGEVGGDVMPIDGEFENWKKNWRENVSDRETILLILESELNIEQVLLYRSIARKIYKDGCSMLAGMVRGGAAGLMTTPSRISEIGGSIPDFCGGGQQVGGGKSISGDKYFQRSLALSTLTSLTNSQGDEGGSVTSSLLKGPHYQRTQSASYNVRKILSQQSSELESVDENTVLEDQQLSSVVPESSYSILPSSKDDTSPRGDKENDESILKRILSMSPTTMGKEPKGVYSSSSSSSSSSSIAVVENFMASIIVHHFSFIVLSSPSLYKEENESTKMKQRLPPLAPSYLGVIGDLDGDEVSVLTMDTVTSTVDNLSNEHRGLRNRVTSASAKPLFSCVISRINLSGTGNEQQKQWSRSYSVGGVCIEVRGAHLLSCGDIIPLVKKGVYCSQGDISYVQDTVGKVVAVEGLNISARSITSRVRMTLDYNSIEEVVIFFQCFPDWNLDLVPKSPYDGLRRTIAGILEGAEFGSDTSFDSINMSVKFEGADVSISTPCPSTNGHDNVVPTPSDAEIRLCFGGASLLKGSADSMVKDALPPGYSFASGLDPLNKDSKSFTQIKLNESIQNYPSQIFSNMLITLSELNVQIVIIGQKENTLNITDGLVHLHLLYSRLLTFNDSRQPIRSLTLITSPLNLRLSDHRLKHISMVVSSFQGLCVKDSNLQEEASPEISLSMNTPLPRISLLACYLLSRTQVHIPSLFLSLEKDNNNDIDIANGSVLEPTQLQEVILEESLSDFLSQVACYNLANPPENSIRVAMEICADRIHALGVSLDEALRCVTVAQKYFIEEMDLMKKSQEDTYENEIFLGMSALDINNTPRSSLNRTNLIASMNRPSRAFTSDACIYDNDDNITVNTDDTLDSEESLEIVETTIRTAVERTIKAMSIGQLMWRPGLMEIAVECSGGLNVLCDRYSYDTKISGDIESLVVRNAAGMKFLKLQPIQDDNHLPESPIAIVRPSVIFSSVEKDVDEEFADGGELLSILASEEQGNQIGAGRRSEKNTDFVVGKVSILFSNKSVDNAFLLISPIINSWGLNKKLGSKKPSNTLPTMISKSSKGEVSCISAVFCTDELEPFMQFSVKKSSLHIIKTSALEHSGISSHVKFVCDSLNLLDQSPQGSSHPTIVEPITSVSSTETKIDPMVDVTISLSKDISSFPSELQILISNARVVLLRRVINEIFQYFLYSDYGLGNFVLKHFPKDILNPSHPMHFHVRLIKPSIITPKNSHSADLLAFEPSDLVIFNSYHQHSWETPKVGKKTHRWQDNSSAKGDCRDNIDLKNEFSKVDVSESIHECFKENGRANSSKYKSTMLNTSLSSESKNHVKFDKTWILRINISAKNIRIFTGILGISQINFDKSKNNMSSLRQPFVITEKVRDGQKVFNIPEDHYFPGSESKWEEITTNPVQLEVLSDITSTHTRLLLRDHISTSDNIEESFGIFGLDMSMSQFYCLLSVWYENMQELPLMFPYSEDFIRKAAISPPCPKDFPEYGSENFVQRMKKCLTKRSEIVISLQDFSINCSFDQENSFYNLGSYFMADSQDNGVCVHTKNCVVHMMTDIENVMRIGCGACYLLISDNRENKTIFSKAIEIGGNVNPLDIDETVDLSWGLNLGIHSLLNKQSLPFKMSLYMTPNRWCHLNLGLESMSAKTTNLAVIWILLEYFGKYFQDPRLHPYFAAEDEKERMKSPRWEQGNARINGKDVLDDECLNLDIRLWLLNPHLSIPSNPFDCSQPCLTLESDNGLFYRYKSVGYTLVSQEICSSNLDIGVMPKLNANSKPFESYSDNNCEILIKGLNIGIKYDYQPKKNHYNLSVRLPLQLNAHEMHGVEVSDYQVQPFLLPKPTVCKPIYRPLRKIGSVLCDITLSPHYLQLCSNLLMAFIGPYPEEECGNISNSNEECSQSIESKEDSSIMSSKSNNDNSSFSITVSIAGLRLIISDISLGMHLPVSIICIPKLVANVSQFPAKTVVRSNSISSNVSSQIQSYTNDLQCCLDVHFWIDYFKSGLTRSWEPLLEPFSFILSCEKSRKRGQGISFNSECPFHVNITGSLLDTLDVAYSSLSGPLSFIFGKDEKSIPLSIQNRLENYQEEKFEEQVRYTDGSVFQICHKNSPALRPDDRVAFSLSNLTGQKIRFHQKPLESGDFIQYVNHMDSKSLHFPATRSLVRNMRVIEVPFEGGQTHNSDSLIDTDIDASHSLSLQIPGFNWLVNSFLVDRTGKRFKCLRAKSKIVSSKIQGDWRLDNALKLLTDVSFISGGRTLTVSSPFNIVNRTCHKIELALHPDPTYQLNCRARVENFPININDDLVGIQEEDNVSETKVESIDPGATFHIPILLLEASLHLSGSHLGSLWLRPNEHDDNVLEAVLGNKDESSSLKNVSIEFCSSVQLTSLVQESEKMFKKSGVHPPTSKSLGNYAQLSCPIIHHDTETMSPFCYCIEIQRSPLVAPFPGQRNNIFDTTIETNSDPHTLSEGKSSSSSTRLKEDDKGVAEVRSQNDDTDSRASKEKDSKRKGRDQIHGPVAYSLVVHPPIIVENLLPESARFELMHATRGQVVWWNVLKPGESFPVHTVGLDAPLLLLMNIGYCRTPVGEGALVHHGIGNRTDSLQYERTGLNIGSKAVWQKTRKGVNKALTTITESSTTRGEERIQKTKIIRSPSFKNNAGNINLSTSENKLGFETSNETFGTSEKGQKKQPQFYRVEDIAEETTVVDSLGQQLLLKITNIMGGGGQRRITISCPFWILNTTEHCLRYRQEGVKSFVSGTVSSESRDGSRPVDSSDRNYNKQLKTIFPGKPGILAPSQGVCTLESEELAMFLGNKEISLSRISEMAFMFNFQDTISLRGKQRIKVQLVDTTRKTQYTSQWSKSFSLDSVGVSQMIEMNCVAGRTLEISVTISLAPHPLSKYTKFIRFSPRYAIINKLKRPIRLWQDSSSLHPSIVKDGLKDLSGQNNENSNWYYDKDNKNKNSTSNQYEYLFGGSTCLDRKKGTGMNQGTSAHRSALYIVTVGSGDIIPFHLPDTRAEREFRIDYGANWNLTSSFAANITGSYTLKINRVVDLRMLSHVNTRESSTFSVQLPPIDSSDQGMKTWDGQLGIWFEIEQRKGKKNIVVKGTKRGKYAHSNTDVQVGDELLYIDDKPVVEMSFNEAMRYIKDRLEDVHTMNQTEQSDLLQNNVTRTPMKAFFLRKGFTPSSGETNQNINSLILTFETFESRQKNTQHKTKSRMKRNSLYLSSPEIIKSKLSSGEHPLINYKKNSEYIGVSLRETNQSIFVIVQSLKYNPPYRIENRSINHIVYFRQRGCFGPWNVLSSGESIRYTWEEPMKMKKLTVRVGNRNSHMQNVWASSKQGIKLHTLSMNFVKNEDQAGIGLPTTVKLEEIGFQSNLPSPFHEDSGSIRKHLYCHVDTEGETRRLIISDAGTGKELDELHLMESHLITLAKKIDEEECKLLSLQEINDNISKGLFHRSDMLLSLQNTALGGGKRNLSLESFDQLIDDEGNHLHIRNQNSFNLEKNESNEKLEDLVKERAGDNLDGMVITSTNQVIVEVIEALGLKSGFSDQNVDAYCKVGLECKSRNIRSNLFSRNDRNRKGKTYYVEKNACPKWSGMMFVFDVPVEAITSTRGYSIELKMKNYKHVGKHPALGKIVIPLHTLKNQNEQIGYFPLMDAAGLNIFSGKVSGSVKLRLQWIYTVPALLSYNILLSERRLLELHDSRKGIIEQQERVQINELEKMAMEDGFANIPSITRKNKKIKKSMKKSISIERESLKKQQSVSSAHLKLSMKEARLRYLISRSMFTEESKRQRLLVQSDNSIACDTGLDEESVDKSQNLVYTNRSDIDDYYWKGESGNTTRSPDVSHKTHKGIDASSVLLRKRAKSNGDTQIGSLDILVGNKSTWHNIGLLSADTLFSSEVDEKCHKYDIFTYLFNKKMLYHDLGHYFHRRHLRHSIRTELSVFSKSNHKHHLTTIDKIPSWTLACSLLNDSITRKILLPASSSHSDYFLPSSFVGSDNSIDEDFLNNPLPFLSLSSKAPTIMHNRNNRYLCNLFESRELFSKAAQRSLMEIVNQGGWLKVRPITALNLTSNYTKMYVKVRYGSECLITPSVDAKVTPTWTNEDDVSLMQSQCLTHSKKMSRFENLKRNQGMEVDMNEQTSSYDIPDIFKRRKNDLEVYVEPLKTSGSLCLTVIGERLNKKTEIGVLQIPLASAISCCISNDDIEAPHDLSETHKTRMYIRWFPLKDPKDSVALEGDMGYSTRPIESEKISDQLFKKYFAPCIKLAIWWEKDEPTNRQGSTHKDVVDASRPLSKNYLQMSINNLSLTLIDSFQAYELLSFSSTDIGIRYIKTQSSTTIGLAVGWIQIDHQSKNAIDPVVLSPTPVQNPQPTIQLLAIIDNLRSKSKIISFRHIAFALEELNFRVEEKWMFDLWNFYLRLSKGFISRQKIRERSTAGINANIKGMEGVQEMPGISLGFSDTPLESKNKIFQFLQESYTNETKNDQKSFMKRKVYIEKILLGFFKVNISFIKSVRDTSKIKLDESFPSEKDENFHNFNSKKANPVLQESGGKILRRWSENGYDENSIVGEHRFSQSLPNIISMVFPSITDAPVRVNGKVISNIYETVAEVLLILKTYYTKEMLSQLYKIIGSLDFVGNPVMVINSFMKGARDFVRQPFRELSRSPKNPSRLGIGVAKGTLSLFSHATTGVFGFISNISRRAGHLAATVSMDEYFQHWHSKQLSNYAKNQYGQFRSRGIKLITNAIYRPIVDLVVGIAFGCSGLLVEPYKGATMSGKIGFIEGVCRGILGIPLKPIVGIFDAFAHLSESIHDMAKLVNILEKEYPSVKKLRLSYVFGKKNILLPFNPVDARSDSLLKQFPSETIKNFRKNVNAAWEEVLIWAEVIPHKPGQELYIVLSNRRLVLFKLVSELPPVKKWEVDVEKGELTSSIENRGHACVVLCLNSRKSKIQSKYDTMKTKDSLISATNDEFSTMSKLSGTSPLFQHDETISSLGVHTDDQQSQVQLRTKNEEQLGTFNNIGDLFGKNLTSKEENVIQSSEVSADFAYKSKFARIHNAISCLTRNFESIIFESGVGIANEGLSAGYTSFGHFHFHRLDKSEEKEKVKEGNLDGYLENIPWVHDFVNISSDIRHNWDYSDEIKASQNPSDPQWLVKTRARTMFIPLPLPPLPSSLLLNDIIVKETSAKLSKGFVSCNLAYQIIQNHGKKVEESMNKVLEYDRNIAKGNERNSYTDLISYKEGDQDLSLNGTTHSPLRSIHEDDNCKEFWQHSNEATFHHNDLPQQVDIKSMRSSADNTRDDSSVLSSRLDKVEEMLQLLLKNQKSAMNPPIHYRTNSPTASTLTGIGDANNQDIYETERLKQEVLDLKRQLEVGRTHTGIFDSNEKLTKDEKRKKRRKYPWKKC